MKREPKPGMVVIHRTGGAAVIERAKDDGSGWWLCGGSGLSKQAFASDDWKLIDAVTWRRLWDLPDEEATSPNSSLSPEP